MRQCHTLFLFLCGITVHCNLSLLTCKGGNRESLYTSDENEPEYFNVVPVYPPGTTLKHKRDLLRGYFTEEIPFSLVSSLTSVTLSICISPFDGYINFYKFRFSKSITDQTSRSLLRSS